MESFGVAEQQQQKKKATVLAEKATNVRRHIERSSERLPALFIQQVALGLFVLMTQPSRNEIVYCSLVSHYSFAVVGLEEKKVRYTFYNYKRCTNPMWTV